MAGRGPAPKDPAQRRRRNVPTSGEWRELPADEYKGPRPRMPRGLHSASQRTWRAWWASPMAHEWSEADWPGLERLIWLVDTFHRADATSTRLEAMREARLQEDRYGLSPKGRIGLRWLLPGEAVADVVPVTAAKGKAGRWGDLRVAD